VAAYKILIFVGVGVIVTLGIIVGLSISEFAIASQEYDIFVDPFKDEQSLFVMSRVTIQNTGSKPLTNVRANFGGGDIQELGTLKPGQKIIVTPPEENDLLFVMVTTDEGIFVNKAFRTPPKMPGMMGS
jgi:cell division protein FtsW (lipid II flippase)